MMFGAPMRKQDEEETPQSSVDVVHEFRVDSFLEMGFTQKEAEKLAVARDGNGFLVYWRSVKNMLDVGCSHVTAVKILT